MYAGTSAECIASRLFKLVMISLGALTHPRGPETFSWQRYIILPLHSLSSQFFDQTLLTRRLHSL
jgi:hypothetical protein